MSREAFAGSSASRSRSRASSSARARNPQANASRVPASRRHGAGLPRPGRRTYRPRSVRPAGRPRARRSSSCGRCRAGYRERDRPAVAGRDASAVMIRGAKMRRPGSMPRASASLRRLSFTRRLESMSQSTLPGTAAEEPHPDVEEFWRELVAVVEAAEDEARFRRPHSARVGGVRRWRRRVVGLIAVRQLDDLLGVEGLLIHRQGRSDRRSHSR